MALAGVRGDRGRAADGLGYSAGWAEVGALGSYGCVCRCGDVVLEFILYEVLTGFLQEPLNSIRASYPLVSSKRAGIIVSTTFSNVDFI